MRAERSWIADLHPELFPTAKGNFVLFIGEFPGPLQIPLFNPKVLDAPRPSNLILLSPDGEELERIGLPVRGKSMKEWWEVIASPSGKSFLLTHVEDEHREYVLLDAETLERRALWGDNDRRVHRVQTLSDEHLLYQGTNDTFIGTADGSLNSFELPDGWRQFLRDDLILTLSHRPWAITITKTTGEKLLSFDLNIPNRDGYGAGQPFVSGNGRKFGSVITDHGKSKLYVWEVPEKKPIFMISVKYSITQNAEGVLSPEGSSFAVINDGVLSMYTLPKSRIDYLGPLR
jgi:hypothetical protein